LDEVTGDWRGLHSGDHHDLYFSHNIIRVIKLKKNEMGRACGMYGEKEGCIQGFGGEDLKETDPWKT
jgi:hypothetical protein